jgi:hypothetical protein
MPSTRDTTRSGIGPERLEVLQALAAADKRDGHADHAHHRERRAAARIAVHLREHDAGDPHAAVELPRALDRVLPRHGIRDIQPIGRVDRRFDRFELHHQLVVDVEATRRVHDHGVEAEIPGFGQRAARARHRIEGARGIVRPHAGLIREHRQLFDRRRTAHVGRDEQCVFAVLREQLRQLCRGRRLARPLKAQQQDDSGARARGRQPSRRLPEERQHLVAHDADDLLVGRQAAQHFLIDGAVAHAIDESLDDLEVDVRLEQRHADLAQRRLDGLFCQPALSAQRAEDALEPFAQRIKHASVALRGSNANGYRS